MDVIDVNKGSLQEVEIKGHEEPKPFASGAELVRFMDENDMLFHMTEKEADMLLGYLGGHDFLLGEKDGKLYRGDLAYEQGKVRWLNDTIDDAIDVVCEWNYEMVQTAQTQVENPDDFIDFVNKQNKLESLRADERLLDAMFDRTKYGKELVQLAEKMADDFIRDMQSKGGIDAAIKKMTEAVKEGKDLLPDVSPALKATTGRAR